MIVQDPGYIGATFAPKKRTRAAFKEERPAESGADVDPFVEGVSFDGDAPPEPVPMLIVRLLPRDGLTFVGGQSGAGKTFVLVDAAVALATRETFFSYDVTEKVAVIYVAAEGSATISSRIAAAKKHRGVAADLPIAIIKAVPDLTNAKERENFKKKLQAVAAELKRRSGLRVGAVFVDTIAATFSMKDENSAAEINAVCKAAAELGDCVGAATIGAHHYGKDPSTGLRGSSAHRGAGESILAVLGERDETTGKCSNRRLVHSKSRVGEEGPIAAFELRHADLGFDANRAPWGAGYVEVGASLEDADVVVGKKERKPSKAANLFVKCLQEALLGIEEKRRPYPGGPEVYAVDREKVRELFYPRWPADGDAKKKGNARKQAFFRAEGEAIERNIAATLEVDGKQLLWLLK